MDISEEAFEEYITNYLVEIHGYRKRSSKKENSHYDLIICLDWELLLEFITTTQPDSWQALAKQHGVRTKEKFVARLTNEINKRGTLDVLRRGIKDSGCYFQLAYFAPASNLNPQHLALYKQNVLSVIRQCRYSSRKNDELDLVLFLNGLPIITVELKNRLTNQMVNDAKEQYQNDCDPKGEPLLQFKRCLVHFAVDDDEVYMTTRLQGRQTSFLPFNKGRDGGAGNPANLQEYSSAYLWEEIWQPDNLLELIGYFIHLERDKREPNTEKLIFPRYHQRDAVRRIIAEAKVYGTGKNYLIQHSAGSGKSNSIAWLAHRLASLHNEQNERVFDSVIVITDRRVLDRQLQSTIRQFEQTPGVVTLVDKSSDQLIGALQNEAGIIVSTLQKFPVIVNRIFNLTGKKYAIVVDEAHSSQSGESSDKLKKVLRISSLEEAAQIDAKELPTGEDLVIQSLETRKKQTNLSFFAFTATPKQKTLELFGTPHPDGSYRPFHTYTMRQAIEEGFIMDVLQNYVTFETYFSLLKTVADDPRYEKTKAMSFIRHFIELHKYNIERKTANMIEHFWANTQHAIPNDNGVGQAKAMIVTSSRLHAVSYKHAFDAYLKTQGYPFKTLVAFSGEIEYQGISYTEAQMNGFSDKQTADLFNQPEYRFLIVAEKFQTGFDQPLLHTMYVDKLLSGVAAVQTLSRLNRAHPRKTETLVLDFANEADDIQQAFAPYYETTLLSEATDPNKLYDLQSVLADFDLYEETEVQKISELFLKKGEKAAVLQPLLVTITSRYQNIIESERRAEFKHYLQAYVRLYAFHSQIVSFSDIHLERLYLFARLILRKLPPEKERTALTLEENINLESYRIQQISSGKITLTNDGGSLDPLSDLRNKQLSEAQEALSQIIAEINQRFGTNFTDADRVFFAELQTRLIANDSLQSSAKVNSRDNVQLLFDTLFNSVLQTMVSSNFEIFKRINDDDEFGNSVRKLIFEQVYREVIIQINGADTIEEHKQTGEQAKRYMK